MRCVASFQVTRMAPPYAAYMPWRTHCLNSSVLPTRLQNVFLISMHMITVEYPGIWESICGLCMKTPELRAVLLLSVAGWHLAHVHLEAPPSACGARLRARGRATLPQVLNGIYVLYWLFQTLLKRC